MRQLTFTESQGFPDMRTWDLHRRHDVIEERRFQWRVAANESRRRAEDIWAADPSEDDKRELMTPEQEVDQLMAEMYDQVDQWPEPEDEPDPEQE